MSEGGAGAADNMLCRSGFDTAIGMGSAGSPGGDTGDEPGGDPDGVTDGDTGDEPGGADMVATIGSAGTSCALGV